MELLEVLRKLDCDHYEARSYVALVKGGPMQASELARRAKVPSGRIYGVLESLRLRGFVRKHGLRPALYDAAEPRSVVKVELEKLSAGSEPAVAQAEQEWEISRSEREERLKGSWTVDELSGFAREVQVGITNSKKAIYVRDPDLSWVSSAETHLLKDALARRVKISVVSSSRSLESLKDLLEEGIEARTYDHGDESYYVFDGKRIIIRRGNPGGATVLEDRSLAGILISHLDSIQPRSVAVK